MIISAATKKLNNHGYQINVTKDTQWYKRYAATKDDIAISFTIENISPHIKDIYVQVAKQSNRRVLSITAALREAGDVARKVSINETFDQLRYRLLHRYGTGSNLTDSEVLSLKLCTKNQIYHAMCKVFPVLGAIVRRDTYRRRQKRDRLSWRASELWDRTKDVHVKTYPDQAPLRLLRVQTSVDPIQGQKLNRNYVTDTVAGEIPIFAWSPKEATNTMKMMLGEFATAQDCGIIAVGSREEAMQAFRVEFHHSAADVVKDEVQRVERDIERMTEQLAQLKTNLEFTMKKLEVAVFIDGVGNMASMVAYAD